MIETYDDKWNKFESSGKVADYLDFKGMTTKTYSSVTTSKESNNKYNEYAGIKG